MYQWILILHIASFISWMAALFYLPRLYVYHAENKDNSGFLAVVKIMQRKLYKFIGVPAMWSTVLSGASMIFLNSGFLSSYWIYTKIFFVTILIVYFLHLGKLRIKLENDSCNKSGKFFRFYNEVPTILMIIIVVLVVLKPF